MKKIMFLLAAFLPAMYAVASNDGTTNESPQVGTTNDQDQNIIPAPVSLPTAPIGKKWVPIINNADFASDDLSSFVIGYEKEVCDGKRIVDAADGTKMLEFSTPAAFGYEWGYELFFVFNEKLQAGDELFVSFSYMSESDVKVATLAYAEPFQYNCYPFLGDLNFSNQWKSFSYQLSVSESHAGSDGIGLGAIEFAPGSLAAPNAAFDEPNKYYFANVQVYKLTPKVPGVDPDWDENRAWSRTYCQYDADGATYRFTEYYNINDNNVETLMETKVDDDWVPSIKQLFTYDGSWYYVGVEQYCWENDEWVLTISSKFTRDDSGRVLACEETQYGEQGTTRYLYEYTLDSEGRQTVMTTYILTGDEKVPYTKSITEYVYDETLGWETIRKCTTYTWNGEWVESYWYEYVYAPNMVTIIYHSAEEHIETKETQTTDDDGKVLDVTKQQQIDGKWVNMSKVKYAYDEYGSVTSMTTYEWRDGKWVNLKIEQRVYDENRNIIRRVYSVWDGKDWRSASYNEYKTLEAVVTAIDDVCNTSSASATGSRKVLKNGKLSIERQGATYDVNGMRIR